MERPFVVSLPVLPAIEGSKAEGASHGWGLQGAQPPEFTYQGGLGEKWALVR